MAGRYYTAVNVFCFLAGDGVSFADATDLNSAIRENNTIVIHVRTGALNLTKVDRLADGTVGGISEYYGLRFSSVEIDSSLMNIDLGLVCFTDLHFLELHSLKL